MNLVSTEWLEKNLNAVKIFDASWHMPSTNRDAIKEYEQKHIIGAILIFTVRVDFGLLLNTLVMKRFQY